MTVLSGLSNLYAAGYDLSGDTGAIQRIGGGPGMLDVSTVDLAGMKRISGRFDGEIGYNVWLNPAGAHVHLGALPQTAVPIMVPIPPEDGAIVAMLLAKYAEYNPAIGNDLAASFAVRALASESYPIEWGKLITDGKRTDTSATASGTGIDLGIPDVAAVNISATSEDDPTEITTATAHGLQTGDSVLIAGDNSTPALNGGHTVTVTGDDTFTIDVEVTTAGSAGTVQRTSHRGWAAQSQVFSVTGTSVTVAIQNAPNNVAGEFADLTAGGFTAVTSGAVRGAQRIASTAGIVQRFVRVKTTGTFNPATYAVGIHVTPG